MNRSTRKTRKTSRAFLLLALPALLAGCADSIGRTELLDQLGGATPPVVVDVRSRSEFAASHVPGALHIPFHSILSGASELPEPTDEGRPIVLYCEHGPRAGLARAQLWFVSDQPVRFLEGHMIAWKEEGLPVESGSIGDAGGSQ